ncbi:O-antigen ligase family protein [Azospirillum sp.]|uniref:O-antigen ligase family protein n=1 Tax=Azospirillum sp. TaxID=34012 RepID=UPI003D730EBF
MSANTILFRLLLAATLLAPLPLGSNRPWAWSLLAVVVGALLLAWSVRMALGRAPAAVPFSRLWPVALPYGLVLAWAFLQTTTATASGLWHPMWGEALAALGSRAGAGMITADPALTMTAVLRLACYAGIFWLSVQLGRDRGRAREAVVALCAAETVYALYGLIVHFVGWESILWLKKWAYLGDLTSTFVNRNAYGAYAGLGVVCCIGLFVNALRPSHAGGRRAYDMAEVVLLRALPYLACGLLIGTALLLSHSRGAFLSTALALGVLLLILAMGGVMRPRLAIPLTAAVALVGLVALSTSGDVTLSRLVEQTSEQHEAGRANVYRLTLDAITDAPYTGMGLGAFLPAFRMYRDTTLSDPVVWDLAHNIPLELAMDLGIPATLLFGLPVLIVLAMCVRGVLRRRRDRIYPALAIAGSVLLGAHGLVDFSAQMPAIATTLALLLGLGYAQSWNTEGRDGKPAADGSGGAPA